MALASRQLVAPFKRRRANRRGDQLRRLHHETYPAQAQAVTEARRAVARVLGRAGVTQATLERIRLAVSEAATNAVLHAYGDGRPGEFRVIVDVDDDQVTIVVADDGSGLTPGRDRPGLGLGLPLMGQMSDGLIMSDGHGAGTMLTMTFRPRPKERVAVD
jgi:serine/threonine-protein kinase RsbW